MRPRVVIASASETMTTLGQPCNASSNCMRAHSICDNIPYTRINNIIFMFSTCQDAIELVLLFSCSLLIFTWGLSSQEMVGFDSRFYLFAQEMWRNGLSLFPTTYHQPYPDYPATSTWLIYMTAKLFSGMNKWTAVLPSALLAAMTCIFTYLIGALHNKRWGLYAVLFLLLTATFIKSARSISLDMYPTLITTLCFYLIYSADKTNKPSRAKWVYLLLLLGFAVRGPIGLVMPTGVICAYYLLDRKVQQFFLVGCLAVILLLVCSAVLLGLAYYVGGDTFMRDVLRMEVVGRIENHFLPWYFYFTHSLDSYALVFPFSVLVFLGVIFYRYTKPNDFSTMPFLMKLLAWMLVVLIGMSIPDDKKARYILPMLPAAALIAAYPWFAPASQRYFAYLRTGAMVFFFVWPLLLLLAILTLYFYTKQQALHFNLAYDYAIALLIIMQVINVFIYLFIVRTHLRETGILCVASLSFVIVYLLQIEPAVLYINRARDFVKTVEMQRHQQRARLVFYKEKPDGLPIKYLINMPRAEQPAFIDNQHDLMTFTAPAFFVASLSFFDELPKESVNNFDIIAKDSLGHVPVVVFARKKIL